MVRAAGALGALGMRHTGKNSDSGNNKYFDFSYI